MEISRAVSVANGPSPTLSTESASGGDPENGASDQSSIRFQQNGRQRQKHNDPARDISIQVLEKFSLVTRFARETTSQLFRESHIDAFTPNERKKHNQSTHDHQSVIMSNDSQKVPEDVSETSDPPSDPLEVTY